MSASNMTEAKVLSIFNDNWVFKLYNWWHPHPYIILALVVSLIPFSVGLFFSLFWKVSATYLINGSLWLNTLSFFLAFIAFGWFTRKLPNILVSLSGLFENDDMSYEGIIIKWARGFANKNWLVILAGLPFAFLNLKETVDIWSSLNPPFLLYPLVNSNASAFFMVIYGFMHGIIVPLVLGSGMVGMIGVLGLLINLFQGPLKLAYYRRTIIVIELTSWLTMWALVGLASILLFGRSFILVPVDIPSIKMSALLQSIPATLLVLGIESIPLTVISNAIKKAKWKELNRLEATYEQMNMKLTGFLEKSAKQQDISDELTKGIKELSQELEIISTRIREVENIPSLPIGWPAIAGISASSLVSMGSPYIKDYLEGLWKNLIQ